ncbi:MAG: ribosomal protein L7/L12 [Erysipelotrichaceae bacterium]|nr:ribosomal protein L7/L12 [Erysipelotrichaceae bacterium]
MKTVFEENRKLYKEFKGVMSGSLVAQYKISHDDRSNKEYIQRLMTIGFSEPQAHNMIMFELMIIKHDKIEMLADRDYILKAVIDKNRDPLPQGDDWYVDHQWFLMSELVKIWDEAEYIWKNERETLNEDVKKCIYSITRYSGAELFIRYINMIAERTGTDTELVKRYAMAEQGLLFKYKWKESLDDPYWTKSEQNKVITLCSMGKEKVETIGILRRITDGKLSLKEAIDIVENKLPYTINAAMDSETAKKYVNQFEKAGAKAEISELED